MADEIDMANDYAEKLLASALLQHQRGLNQAGDVEAEICNGCAYATKASWGKKCDGWRDCLDDHERAYKAKRRNG